MQSFCVITKVGKWIAPLSMLFAFGLSAAHAAAEDPKIALVDMQKALQQVEAGKSAKTQLDKEATAKKKEIDTEMTSLNKAGEEFRKQSLVMNEEARNKKQAELQERFMKLQQTRGKYEEELRKREQELVEPIISKLKGIVADIAKKKGYTLALEKNENIVIFSQEKDDLTSEVVSTYNKLGKS